MATKWLRAAAALACVPACVAQAQAPTDAPTEQRRAPSTEARVSELGAIVVTGSRLRRTDVETASPVQVITRDEIARSGAASLGEVMQRLPANNTSTFNEGDPGSNGATGVSLHGMGASSTLVLVNGRRVSSFGFADPYLDGAFVDLNQIPVSVIERVEVLLDGASAIYGSDAIAGVVNVILRRDFRGAEAALAFGRSSRRDATQRQATLTLGFGDRQADGHNLFAAFSHSDQDPVAATARPNSRSSDYRAFGLPDYRTPQAYPGNLYTADNRTFLQRLPGCSLIGGPDSANPDRCLFDAAQRRDIVVESRRDSLFIAGSAALPRGFELFGDAAFTRTVSSTRLPGYPTASYFNLGVLPDPFIRLPVGHPQNPYPDEVALRTRFNDVPQSSTPTSHTQRAVVGLRHPDLAGWDVESGLLWSHSMTRVVSRGAVNNKVLLGEVLDAEGRAVPSFHFGDPSANDPELMARLYTQAVAKGRTTTSSIDLRGRRDVFGMSGGAAQFALGAELRREHFTTAPDPLVTAGDLTFLNGWTADQSRTVVSSYAELSLPLLRTLEATLALRYDHYSVVGGTTNSKAGLKWQVAPGLVARAGWSTAFRAPSPVETGQTPIFGVASVRDPKTCPVPDTSNPNCDRVVVTVQQGNPDLQPERARSTTAGLVVEPWRDVSFTIDAFRNLRRDETAFLDTTYLLAHEADYPAYVVRNADGTLDRLLPHTVNRGKGSIWGIDASVQAKTTIDGIGRLGVEGRYEWLPHYHVKPSPEDESFDYAGTYLQPKSRGSLAASLDRGPFRSTVTFNYTGKYLLAYSGQDLSCPYDASGTNQPQLCSIKAWRTFDLFLGYNGVPGLELGLLIRNIADAQAPFDTHNTAGSFLTYSPAFHNALGRYFQLSAKYAFR